MAGALMFGVVVLFVGEACRTGRMTLGGQTLWPGNSVSFGYFAIVIGLWFSAAGLMQLIRPARLLLEPAGLAYVGAWWRRHWHWRDVGEFTVEEVGRGAKAIRFDAPVALNRPIMPLGDARATIPGGWQASIEEICGELNAARAKWR